MNPTELKHPNDWPRIIELFELICESEMTDIRQALAAHTQNRETIEEVVRLWNSHKAVKTTFLQPRVLAPITEITADPEHFFRHCSALNQSFAFESLLGTSPHSVVVRARDLLLGRQVVIKITGSGLSEASIMAQFQAAHIVRILSIIETGHADLHGLIMPYQSETTLADALKHASSWTPEQFLTILIDLAAALALAHENGILHLDVKPNNILIDEDRRAFLMDFNVSIKWRDLKQGLNQVRGGTTHYMPPEQEAALKGEVALPMTDSADIFSFGRVISDILPFIPDSSVLKLRLSSLAQQCTHPNPKDRPFSAKQLENHLSGSLYLKTCQAELEQLQARPLGWFQAYPRLTIYSFIILTNLFASIMQILYNHTYVIDNLTEGQKHLFNLILIPWNAFAFTCGFFCIYWPFRDLFVFFDEKSQNRSITTPEQRHFLRTKLLRFQKTVIRVVGLLWILGFFVFAIPLNALVAFPYTLALHFFLSFLVALGLATFFSLTPLQLPIMGIGYYWLLHDEGAPQAQAQIDIPDFFSSRRFAPLLAGAIPLFTALMMIWFFNFDRQRILEYRILLSLFIALSIGGFFLTVRDSLRLETWRSTLLGLFKST